MKKFLALLALAWVGFAHSQDTTKNINAGATKNVKSEDDKIAKTGWTKGGLISIGLTQVGNSNWIAAGGDKFSLSTIVSLNVFANKKWAQKTWDNELDVNYGIVNTTT